MYHLHTTLTSLYRIYLAVTLRCCQSRELFFLSNYCSHVYFLDERKATEPGASGGSGESGNHDEKVK